MLANILNVESATLQHSPMTDVSTTSLKLSQALRSLHQLPKDDISLLNVPYSPLPRFVFNEESSSRPQPKQWAVIAVTVGFVAIFLIALALAPKD
jgi:hypothetical protein